MEAREIKRVSEGEIVEKALQMGNTIADSVELYISTDGQYSLLKELEIERNSDFLTYDEISTFDGKRFQVFDAYAYNAENGLKSEAGVQILEGDTILLYTRPAYFEGKDVGIYFIDFSRKEIVLSIKK